MITTEKIEQFKGMIGAIDYHHREGGQYAYLQFLSYTRELLLLLQPLRSLHGQCSAIERINLEFNESLTARFGEDQRLAFDRRRRELRLILESLKEDPVLRIVEPAAGGVLNKPDLS